MEMEMLVTLMTTMKMTRAFSRHQMVLIFRADTQEVNRRSGQHSWRGIRDLAI